MITIVRSYDIEKNGVTLSKPMQFSINLESHWDVATFETTINTHSLFGPCNIMQSHRNDVATCLLSQTLGIKR